MSAPTVSGSLPGRQPATTASIVRTRLTLTMPLRSPGLYGAESSFAIAKELSAPYRPGERKGMVKVKRVRTIDAVVAGWRPGKEPDTVGALMLGLYEPPAGRGALRVGGHGPGFP